MKKLICVLTCITFSLGLAGQNENQGLRQYTVKKIDSEISIDGVLDEVTWLDAIPIGDFWQYFPSDSKMAEQNTWLAMVYDDTHLYVAIKCFASSNDFLVSNLKRDFSAFSNENIALMFDPFNDRQNAFLFGMNPEGVQRESLVSGGGNDFRNSFNSSWDNKWEGETQIYEDHYTCEIAIPFTTIRYGEKSQDWSFNSYRLNLTDNERSTWMHVPKNQVYYSLAFMGNMHFEEPLNPPGVNISVIPYTITSWAKDYETGDPTAKDFDIGGDAKVAVTPGLNLDLTVNPDFSQVEVDRQVTNLSRFEIFFPERRQFFTENADLFGGFGDSRINPFFSRRIGISRDTTLDQNIENPIWGGARLSGKINEEWRIGFLDMQTANDPENGLPSFNYMVTALQKKVGARSNVGVIFVNKQHFSNAYDDVEDLNKYNRVVGIDYNLASSDNVWTGKFFLHHSMSPTSTGKEEFSHGVNLTYRKRKIQASWSHSWVGDDFNAEVGFVPRHDFYQVQPRVQLNFYPDSKLINDYNIYGQVNVLWKPEYGKTDHELQLGAEIDFLSTTNVRITAFNEYIYLTQDFDPTRSDGEELKEGTDYSNFGVRLRLRNNNRKALTIRFNPSYSQFYNGTRLELNGNIGYKLRPLGTVSVDYNYNRVRLPKPYSSADLYLIGPKIDLTFSKSLFFSTLVQYNSQIDNMNINARFQWRFKPVSDLYIVYTDNYNTEFFGIKNRSIVAKLTYWLNL